MQKFKSWLMSFVAIVGVILIGYHWTDNYSSFESPTITNIPFVLAIVFWTVMAMIVLYSYVQKNIRDKWKEKSINLLSKTCIVIIAFSVGCTIANLGIIMSVTLTLNEILPIIIIPIAITVWAALKPEKSSWIGGDPSKS